MKITIDEKQCLKHNLTLQDVFMILAIREGKVGEVVNNLKAREVVVSQNKNLKVTQSWSDKVDEIICDSTEGGRNDDELLELAKRMREVYPQGKMPGTAYYYRCNNKEVMLKLKKFFISYRECNDYTNDEIIDATQRFVASFKGNYKFMPLIKYFISKNKPIVDEEGNHKSVEVSELASYLENKIDDEDIPNVENTEDWMMNSRN